MRIVNYLAILNNRYIIFEKKLNVAIEILKEDEYN